MNRLKDDRLRESGTFNNEAEKLKEAIFIHGGFFDKYDLMQVKYEMLRAVKTENRSIVSVASDFGLSRTAYYKALKDFTDYGLAGLLPGKRGPHGPYKLNNEILSTLYKWAKETPQRTVNELHEKLQSIFKIKIHPKTIRRALAEGKQKKGR